MIAEIHNKINQANSNLSERSEDELTGNFFGNLRYLPFNRGFSHILRESIYPAELSSVFDAIDAEEWHKNIQFWMKYDGTEPDVLISFPDVLILIEVKYKSGISSDDVVDNSGVSDDREREESCHQLYRESKVLEHLANGRDKILILLAKEDSAHTIYADVIRRNLLKGVRFGYITWQKAFDALQSIDTISPYECLIIGDLIELLRKKGFEGFRCFEMPDAKMVEPGEPWIFDYTASVGFAFGAEQKIVRGLFYEYR